MRLITIEEYDESSMELARPVYDFKKRILLASGTRIHPKYMEKLHQIGIKYLFIEDSISKGITLEEMIDMPTWVNTIEVVEKLFQQAIAKKPLSTVELQQTVKKFIEEVKQRKIILLIPSSAINSALQPFAHVVNVTLISLQIGKKLGLNYRQLYDLGVGCFLHDIGKSQTEIKEDHPEKGFNIIRSYREISLISAHIAFQHHETIDGQGYPRKLKENDILELAQVCSVANTYENMVSIENITPQDAIENILALSDSKYSFHIVQAFNQSIAGYPPGTRIRLSNKEEGIVTRIDSHLQRPVVRLDSTNAEVDLSEEPTLLINEIITNEQASNTI